MALVEAVQQHALDPLPGGAGEFGHQPLARGLLQFFKGFKTERLGEFVVDLGVLRRFDQGSGGFEFGRLAGEFLAGVVLRKRNFQVAGFARCDADQLLFKARNELPGADRHLDVLAGAAVERRAVDGALEGDRDPVAALGLGAVALGGKRTILVGDALDGLVNLGVGHFDHRLLDREALEVGERNRGHDLDRNGVGEIGFSGEDVLDGFLFRGHRDLGLGRQPEAALGEDLRVGVADGLVDGLRHHRAAIYLLQVADRHLAWTKAVETDLVLEFHETDVRLGIEIRCGNADLEFVLQSLSEGFGDLHGVNLLPAWSGLNGPDIVNSGRRATPKPAPVVRRTPFLRATGPSRDRSSSIHHANAVSAWCGRRDSNPHNFRHWNLNPARLPVPPRPLIALGQAVMPGHDVENREAVFGWPSCSKPLKSITFMISDQPHPTSSRSVRRAYNMGPPVRSKKMAVSAPAGTCPRQWRRPMVAPAQAIIQIAVRLIQPGRSSDRCRTRNDIEHSRVPPPLWAGESHMTELSRAWMRSWSRTS